MKSLSLVWVWAIPAVIYACVEPIPDPSTTAVTIEDTGSAKADGDVAAADVVAPDSPDTSGDAPPGGVPETSIDAVDGVADAVDAGLVDSGVPDGDSHDSVVDADSNAAPDMDGGIHDGPSSADSLSEVAPADSVVTDALDEGNSGGDSDGPVADAPDVIASGDCVTNTEELLALDAFVAPTYLELVDVGGFQGGVQGCEGADLPQIVLSSPPGPCLVYDYYSPPGEPGSDCDGLLDPFSVVRHKYDCELRPIEVLDSVNPDFDEEHVILALSWNDQGLLTKQVKTNYWWLEDDYHEVYTYEYDADGNLIADTSEVHGALGVKFTRSAFYYSKDGLLTKSELFKGPPGADTLESQTEFSYNDDASLALETTKSSTGATIQIVSYEYVSWEEGALERVLYDYNCGDVTQTGCIDGDWDTLEEFYYGQGGQLVRYVRWLEGFASTPGEEIDHFRIEYTYDESGNVTGEFYHSQPYSEIPYRGWSYFYDELGRRTADIEWVSYDKVWEKPYSYKAEILSITARTYSCWDEGLED